MMMMVWAIRIWLTCFHKLIECRWIKSDADVFRSVLDACNCRRQCWWWKLLKIWPTVTKRSNSLQNFQTNHILSVYRISLASTKTNKQQIKDAKQYKIRCLPFLVQSRCDRNNYYPNYLTIKPLPWPQFVLHAPTDNKQSTPVIFFFFFLQLKGVKCFAILEQDQRLIIQVNNKCSKDLFIVNVDLIMELCYK